MSTVVVATDLSRVSTRAVDVGIDLARRLSARLLLLNVLDLGRLSGRGRHDRVDQARAEREPVLLEMVRAAREAGVEAEFLLWQGSPVETISEAATSEGAEMIVVGSHRRRGPGRMLLGSVSDGLARTARVPVLIVPAETDAPGEDKPTEA
jgi:nucleotide-binding universal stress UspA family protein